MSLVTRCSNCGTTFRVQAAQLSTRGGRVRCGKCNHVFDGLGQIVEDDEHNSAPSVGPSPQLALFDPQRLAAEAERAAAAKAEAEAAARAAAARAQRYRATAPSPDDAEFLAEDAPRSRYLLLWSVLSAIALVAIAAQAAIHFRTDLILLAPQTRSHLEALCDMLGCEVHLPRQPDLMAIESSELRMDPERNGIIRLTALLRNRAPFAQEYPALELALTNESDQPVVRRVLRPQDYLGAKDAQGKIPLGIAPGAEVVVSIELEPLGMRAAGFRLYLFYPPSAQ